MRNPPLGYEWQAGDDWRAKAFRVQLRSMADIVVLQAPPWWTLKKVLWIAGALGFVTLAAFSCSPQLQRVPDRAQTSLRCWQYRLVGGIVVG